MIVLGSRGTGGVFSRAGVGAAAGVGLEVCE